MNKKILLGLGLPMVIGLPVLTTLSCAKSSSNTNGSTSVKTFKTLVKRSATKNDGGAVVLPTDVNIYDGNFNPNAQSEIEKIKESLTIEQLNNDFQKVLTDFYESYEKETPTTEVEIDNIVVISKKDNNTFVLEVTYEVETEKPESNDSGSKENEEQMIVERIDWSPTLKLISKDEIKKIKDTIIQYSNKDNQHGIDLSDIKELFLGENDADDDDDYGIFDRIAKLNKDYDGLAHLVGYEISISDIYDKLQNVPKRKQGTDVDTKTKFSVPSISLNMSSNTGSNGSGTIFLPDRKPIIDLTPKAGLTKQNLDEIFTSQDKAQIIQFSTDAGQQIVSTLNKVLATQITVDKINSGQTKIEFIALLTPTVNGTEDQYQLIIEYADKGLEADMIVLTPAPETTPLPPTPAPLRS